jgi:hypothetical protein
VSPVLRELKKFHELGNGGKMITLTLNFQDGDWLFPRLALQKLVFEFSTMIFTANMLYDQEFKNLMQELDGSLTYVLVIDSFTKNAESTTKCQDGLVRRTKEHFIDLANSTNLELVHEYRIFEGTCNHFSCDCQNAKVPYEPVYALLFLHKKSGLKMKSLKPDWSNELVGFTRTNSELRDDPIFHGSIEDFQYSDSMPSQ